MSGPSAEMGMWHRACCLDDCGMKPFWVLNLSVGQVSRLVAWRCQVTVLRVWSKPFIGFLILVSAFYKAYLLYGKSIIIVWPPGLGRGVMVGLSQN
ncbi:hypothetical protein B0T14DRAFT_195952 [Immersiella caudata]|uniref:Uncharacterized protein n=1 Tax=Immersiella caudata TaxID=314043 RepID=A0AA39X042_9PEZI|nr:hypothetical protein B0T14DRAFT_195952 [Immersiella caudata]